MRLIKSFKDFKLMNMIVEKNWEKNPIDVKDDRQITWAELEAKAAEQAPKKDPNFKLEGPWKSFLKDQDGYKVYIVDGNWVRANLSIIFGHGAHGFVHEWCPNDEIWIDECHLDGCCNTQPGSKCSKNFIESTILHEITENKEMRKGKPYWIAHNMALETEIEAGFLKDPYNDSNQ